MKTKYLVRFLNNSAHMDADLELIDIIQVATINNRLNCPGSGSGEKKGGKQGCVVNK